MKYRSFTIRFAKYLWRQWRNEITRGGQFLVYAFMVSAFGAVSVQMPIYQVFCGLLTLWLVTGFVGFVLRPKVSISGNFPEKTTAGESITGEFTLTNISRWPSYDVAVGLFELPRSLRQIDGDLTVPVLASGAREKHRVTLQPLKRGLYELPKLRAYSMFPFRIVRFGNCEHRCRPLLVLPAFHAAEGIDVPVGSRYQPGGIALTSNVGESPEYIGNREYVPGDSVRRLDFRSWARLGKPVVREFQEEYYCRIAMILDTFVPSDRKADPEGFADLEAAVSVTAAVADVLSDGEYIIDLFAAGPELHVFRAGRHTAHFENLLELLACVDACRDNPFDVVTPAVNDELGNISTAICVFLDWDESREQLARTALEAGCSLKIIVVRDTETTLPIDDWQATEISQYSTAQVRRGSLGVL